MSRTPELSIDLANPQDIRKKLPRVIGLYEAKREELNALTAQVRYWGELADNLARIAGEPPVTPRDIEPVAQRSAPGQALVIEALERAGRPMGPSALHRFMLDQGMEAPSTTNAVGANLWAAAKAGRVRKLQGGRYAPLPDASRAPLPLFRTVVSENRQPQSGDTKE